VIGLLYEAEEDLFPIVEIVIDADNFLPQVCRNTKRAGIEAVRTRGQREDEVWFSKQNRIRVQSVGRNAIVRKRGTGIRIGERPWIVTEITRALLQGWGLDVEDRRLPQFAPFLVKEEKCLRFDFG